MKKMEENAQMTSVHLNIRISGSTKNLSQTGHIILKDFLIEYEQRCILNSKL